MKIRTREQLDRVRDECRAMVTQRALMSGGAAAIPIPGAAAASALADGGMLFDLLPRINRAFGLSVEQIDELDEQTRQQVLVLLGKVGNAVIGKVVTEKVIAGVLTRVGARVAAKSALSFVPFVGSTVAAGISFGMMKAVGNGHVADCYRIVERMLDGESEAEATEAAATA